MIKFKLNMIINIKDIKLIYFKIIAKKIRYYSIYKINNNLNLKYIYY